MRLQTLQRPLLIGDMPAFSGAVLFVMIAQLWDRQVPNGEDARS
jgi:hypothetical protein